MRKRSRTAAVVALTSALTLGPVVAGTLSAAHAAPATTSWSAPLAEGEGAGVAVGDDGARLDPAGTHLAPAEPDPSLTEGGPDATLASEPVPTGLLTLPARTLETPADRVDTAVDGDLPEGSTATVDVRGRRANGAWTEWIPADRGSTALPEPTTEVQPRLVLAGATAEQALVRDVRLTATPAPPSSLTEGTVDDLAAAAEGVALNYRVFATREGLVGGTTANGHVIAERDHFVALPSRRALAPRGSSDYSVKVCAPNGRCAFAPVWDVGPWNTRDDYWNPPAQRQEWRDLPQGLPQAQAAHLDGYNGGKDQYGRTPSNPAGIDLGDGMFWDALGLKDNSWVTVDYLWTGTARLSRVVGDEPVEVRAAPDAAAEVVGVAAGRATVPVHCAMGGAEGWLQIGEAQFVPAAAAPPDQPVADCDAPATGEGVVTGTAAAGQATTGVPGPPAASAGQTGATGPAAPMEAAGTADGDAGGPAASATGTGAADGIAAGPDEDPAAPAEATEGTEGVAATSRSTTARRRGTRHRRPGPGSRIP
jgi:hypothetical protein